MTESKISALLGRPLTTTEIANFNTYLKIAHDKVSDLIYSDICSSTDIKKFFPRHGYRTLNTPIFNEIYSIEIDGVETEDYTPYQRSSMNGNWFNSIVFDEVPDCKVIEIEADWGFSYLPNDVAQMVAEQFALASSLSPDDGLVSSKQVEDFRITYKGNTKQEAFTTKYASTISKYSGNPEGNVQHGTTYGHFYFV